MTSEEWLDKYGPEYRITMEKDRQSYFLDSLIKICTVFKCTEMVNELNENFPMVKFLETFYNAGFYKGLSYGFDMGEHHIVEDSDIPLKYSQEIADEINQEILNKTMT